MNKPIQLTEQDLHMLVEDAVRAYINENGMDEFLGGMGSLFGSANNAVQKKYRAAKEGMQNLGQNMANTYRQGNYNAQVQKQGNIAMKSLMNFKETATQAQIPNLVKNIASAYELIRQAMAESQEQLNNVKSKVQ